MKIRRGLGIVAVILVQFMSVQQSQGVAVNAEPHQPVITWGGDRANFRAKREEISSGQSTNSSDVKPVDKTSSTTSGSSVPKVNATGTAAGGGTTKTVKEKTLIIPDRTPANFSIAQIKEETLSEEEEDNAASKRPGGKGDFDEKAVQRTIIVIGGIAVIVMVYLGIKLILIKRRKVVKRYGRVEASEMDLLDEVEDDDESEEEEELFDINQRRRS